MNKFSGSCHVGRDIDDEGPSLSSRVTTCIGSNASLERLNFLSAVSWWRFTDPAGLAFNGKVELLYDLLSADLVEFGLL